MKKTAWLVAILVLITGISMIYFYHKPEKIERVHQSVIYSMESQFEKETTVILKGELYKNFFGRDVFIGKLKTDEDLEYEIKLTEHESGFTGVLTRLDDNKNIETIGSVMTSSHFDKVWMQLDDINERYDVTGGYIGGPAITADEANAVARSIQESRP